ALGVPEMFAARQKAFLPLRGTGFAFSSSDCCPSSLLANAWGPLGLTSLFFSQRLREPGSCGAPIPQNRSFGNLQKLRDFGNFQPAEKTAFDHGGLARIHFF